MKKMLNEFKDFINKGNVVDLAVGVLIGSAFSSIVTSLTNNIISPIIGMFGEADFSGMILNIHVGIIKLNLKYGAFLTDVINFVIMAFIIFLIVKFMNKIMTKKEEQVEEKVNEELEVLKEIRDNLKK
jgi:large conductance mechanosensitive channel